MLKLSKQSAEFTPKVVDYLNGLIRCDQKAMQDLLRRRVPCNVKLACHPTCQCIANKDGTDATVGMLGVLNGLFGIDPDGWGPIAAVIEDDGSLSGFICTPGNKLPEIEGEGVGAK